MARLLEIGIEVAEDDPTVLVEAQGRSLRFFFQRSAQPKPAKNRLHLDLEAQTGTPMSATKASATMSGTWEGPTSPVANRTSSVAWEASISASVRVARSIPCSVVTAPPIG